LKRNDDRATPAERLAVLEKKAWDVLDLADPQVEGFKERERAAKLMLATVSRLQSLIALDWRLGERARKERHQRLTDSPEWQAFKRHLFERLAKFPEALAELRRKEERP
jgi:hypothetical protein